MGKQKKKGVNEDTAAELHELVVDCMQTDLRAQMMTGDFNQASIRNVLTYLKGQNITVDPTTDPGTLLLIESMKVVSLDGIDDSPGCRW